MKRCELLSPAGNMEMLKYAIAYGADAVYLAGTRFGARKFANNFDEKEIVEAVNYSHIYNVKVYVTINTLVYDDEIEDFIRYVEFISSIGVDAVLVQDLGMMNLIHKSVPELEIHSSTQFHNDGQKTLDFLKSLGIKRAVLDREMSIEDIKKLKTDLELEVFIHGALCVSYSGQCLLSSHVLKRSGNRGECAGLCRLPYKEEGSADYRYYLSLKDLFAKESVYDLIDAGISSLKIEGRMKSPEYVGYLTKIYRSLIDSYYDGSRRDLTQEEIKNIMILFNRGVTPGFMKGASSKDIVNLDSPNHIGIYAGKYDLADHDKVKLQVEEDLRQGDTIRFQEDDKGMTINFLYDENGKLINFIKKGKVAFVDNFLGVKESGVIRLVASKELKDSLTIFPKKSIPIEMVFKARLSENISLEVKEGNHTIKVEGPPTVRAQSRPITKSNIERQLSKTGNTVYSLKKIDIDIEEELFINLKDLNELRRKALEKLDNLRLSFKVRSVNNFNHSKIDSTPCTPRLIVTVETEYQFRVAQKYTDLIFSSNETLLKSNFSVFPKYVNCDCVITTDKYMVCDYGLLMDRPLNSKIYTDYMMNITNSYTANFLSKLGVEAIQLSTELDFDRLKSMSIHMDMSKASFLIYGRLELMKMKYDPSQKASLIDQKGGRYPLKKDAHYNYLLSPSPLDYTDNLDNIRSIGLGYFRIDFFDEDGKTCEKILEKTHKIVHQE